MELRAPSVLLSVVLTGAVFGWVSPCQGQLSQDEELRRYEEMISRGRLAEAESGLRSLLARRPSARARYLLGFTLIRLYQWEEAEETLRRAVDEQPGEAPFHHALAKALQEQDRNREAIEVLERALALEPSPEYFFAKAMCALNAGDLETAEAALRQCLKEDPRHPEALYQLGRLLIDRGDYAASLTYLRRCLAARPDHPDARFRTGLAESRAGRDEAAAEDFEAVLAAVPGHVGALYNLGRTLMRTGRAEEGRERLREFQAMSRRRDEIDFLLQAVKKNPTNLEGRLLVSQKLLEAGRADDALSQLLAARQLRPDLPRTYRLLARAFAHLGRDEDAGQAEAFARHLEGRR